MLVLSRKSGQSVWIGETMCVKVLDVRNGRVRLGLTAPREMPIRRQELSSLSADVLSPCTDIPAMLAAAHD